MADFFHDGSNEAYHQNIVQVKSHYRTAPDGIEQNNLSYTGDDKMPVSTDHVDVHSHIRTAPDGIIENNFSFAGHDHSNTGIHTVMQHDDPLRHIHKYNMEKLEF
jgi:hypothetical protein